MQLLSQLTKDALEFTDIKIDVDQALDNLLTHHEQLNQIMSLEIPSNSFPSTTNPHCIQNYNSIDAQTKERILIQKGVSFNSVDDLYKDWIKRYRYIYWTFLRPNRILLYSIVVTYGYGLWNLFEHNDASFIQELTHTLFLGASILGLTSFIWYPIVNASLLLFEKSILLNTDNTQNKMSKWLSKRKKLRLENLRNNIVNQYFMNLTQSFPFFIDNGILYEPTDERSSVLEIKTRLLKLYHSSRCRQNLKSNHPMVKLYLQQERSFEQDVLSLIERINTTITKVNDSQKNRARLAAQMSQYNERQVKQQLVKNHILRIKTTIQKLRKEI